MSRPASTHELSRTHNGRQSFCLVLQPQTASSEPGWCHPHSTAGRLLRSGATSVLKLPNPFRHNAAASKFYQDGYRLVAAGQLSRCPPGESANVHRGPAYARGVVWRDLSSAFSDYKNGIPYVDWGHYSPRGISVLSQLMLDTVFGNTAIAGH
jgi:hypothetical protein